MRETNKQMIGTASPPDICDVVQFKYDLICTPFVIHYLQMREMIYEQKRNAKSETRARTENPC